MKRSRYQHPEERKGEGRLEVCGCSFLLLLLLLPFPPRRCPSVSRSCASTVSLFFSFFLLLLSSSFSSVSFLFFTSSQSSSSSPASATPSKHLSCQLARITSSHDPPWCIARIPNCLLVRKSLHINHNNLIACQRRRSFTLEDGKHLHITAVLGGSCQVVKGDLAGGNMCSC